MEKPAGFQGRVAGQGPLLLRSALERARFQCPSGLGADPDSGTQPSGPHARRSWPALGTPAQVKFALLADRRAVMKKTLGNFEPQILAPHGAVAEEAAVLAGSNIPGNFAGPRCAGFS